MTGLTNANIAESIQGPDNDRLDSSIAAETNSNISSDYSNANSDDDSSDDDLEELGRFFTSQSSQSNESRICYDVKDDDNMGTAESSYISDLVGEDGLSMTRFEGWIGKDVLLQGKIFLTKRYLLFYAHLPPPIMETLRASPLAKKSARLLPNIGKSSYNRYWFVLRMGSLSWYNDPSDIYFPTGVLALSLMSHVSQVTDAPEKFIIKAQDGRSYTFKADSRNASHQWVKALQKEIFRARNKNDMPAAVVRIPLENMFYVNIIKPLDIVKLINIQVIKRKFDSQPGTRPEISCYTFAFFTNNSGTESIVNRLTSITNDFENQSGVKYNNVKDGIEVDFETSQFGTVTEDVFDTMPPNKASIFDGRELGDDREILHNPEWILSEQVSSSEQVTSENSPTPLSPSVSHNLSQAHPSRSVSRLQSIWPSKSATPTNSYGRSKSKINILSTLNEKLHKLKMDELLKPDASVLTGAASIPMKVYNLVDPSSNEISENEDGADSEYESEEDGTEEHFDDKYLSSSPDNPTKKLAVGTEDKKDDSNDFVRYDSVSKREDLIQLNRWFREHFGLEPSVNLLAEYICSLRKPGDSTSWSGKLFISNQFLCFQRRNVGGGNWRMVIPFKDIIHLTSQQRSSSRLEFEVAEARYSAFRIYFSEPAARRDAESMIRDVINEASNNNCEETTETTGATDAETRFIEYSLRSARLSTYEPTWTKKLKQSIPPLIFDPSTRQYKEIFLQKPMQALKFVMLMIGSRGDVQPYIALCQGLMEEGHKCCIVTHKEFKSWVESFGIEFCPIAGDPSELMEVMISHGSISYGFVKDALSHFKGWLKELMSTCWKAVKHSEADVLIESPSSMIGIHIAEALNIPYFRAFTMPWTRTRAYPQALVAPDQKLGGGYNSFTYLMYDRLVWFAISKYVNKWRKKHLGLPDTDLDMLRQEDVPFLYCVSPTILVPPLDQPDWVHTCGYWELRQDKKQNDGEDHPELVKFMQEARHKNIPLVYIGFGSIIVSDPEAMTQTIVEATKSAGVYCVLARGWSSRSSKKSKKQDKKPISCGHIFEVESVSHQWLFPQMDVCVHHGGSGTTGASLRAGKPTIIKPFFGDQFFYGRRVEDLGVGCYLKKLTTSGLSTALHDCVTNKQMIRQATVLGEQISHEHGVEEGILCIYRELSYAKDVTTRRKQMTLDHSKNGLFVDSLSKLPAPDSFKIISGKFRKKEHDGNESISDDEYEASHSSFFSLPKFGRREQQRQDRDSSGEVDVSV